MCHLPLNKTCLVRAFLCVKEQQQLGQYRKYFPQVLLQSLTNFLGFPDLVLVWYFSSWYFSAACCMKNSLFFICSDLLT